MPLIKRGAVALGRGALKTGVRITDDVLSGQSVKKAAKRCVTDAGKNLMRDLLTPGVRPYKMRAREERSHYSDETAQETDAQET